MMWADEPQAKRQTLTATTKARGEIMKEIKFADEGWVGTGRENPA
jgi:hypothetical protein